MSGPVHADQASLEQLARGLSALQSRTAAGLASFATAMGRALQEADDERRARQRRLAEAESALRNADDEQRPACEAAVRLARAELQAAEGELHRMHREDDRFRSLRRRFEQHTTDAVAKGRSELRGLGADLGSYESGGSTGSGASDGGRAAGATSSGAGRGSGLSETLAAAGLELIDPADVDLGGDDIRNDHERSPSDYRWLVERWDEVVAPGVERGMTRADFAARDAAGGAPEGRRLAEVYDVMLGSGAISVGQDADGTFTVNGGRHRLAAGKALGIRAVPARVHR